ncbi:MAG TPA: hypothetical protein VEW66_08780 [Thermomicrobiales bacterium]|nr:hypothetical protein [Thermomicrobiales bacterium]
MASAAPIMVTASQGMVLPPAEGPAPVFASPLTVVTVSVAACVAEALSQSSGA